MLEASYLPGFFFCFVFAIYRGEFLFRDPQVERTVAYDATTKELTKWDPVVRNIRDVSVAMVMGGLYLGGCDYWFMVYLHYPTLRPIPRQIKNCLHRVLWKYSETDDNIDSHWILCICYQYLSRSLSRAI